MSVNLEFVSNKFIAKFQKAFTMIELIFVIVIIGILAAVAIPKLNATREDAEFAVIATNIRHTIETATGVYMATGDELFWLIDDEHKDKFGIYPETDPMYKSCLFANFNCFSRPYNPSLPNDWWEKPHTGFWQKGGKSCIVISTGFFSDTSAKVNRYGIMLMLDRHQNMYPAGMYPKCDRLRAYLKKIFQNNAEHRGSKFFFVQVGTRGAL